MASGAASRNLARLASKALTSRVTARRAPRRRDPATWPEIAVRETRALASRCACGRPLTLSPTIAAVMLERQPGADQRIEQMPDDVESGHFALKMIVRASVSQQYRIDLRRCLRDL